ncbi:galactose-1-phosphate uridylyltransferase [Zhihengliuella halotolerans]|uniref:Galactose-1-phosphate uridylyltransferase n=1 Tax=Zhihengliuella halotolerans TaxID=370736 RepID=A0A4Q8AG72_9MICC|nr:galactose-1-phosphate uridylyltransferase [Zhihengliuella halotolerans]RZU62841.1 UDPglucose--hexose-1-phosphate uridylyltransferase [Zhihengliuella halotolerans]
MGQPAVGAQPTVTTLADGRDLLYFFDGGAAPAGFTAPADARELPGRPPSSELRYDPLTGEWIAFAAHRQSRTHLPPADECPLCPTSAAHGTEIPAAHYDVVAFENRFPSFGPEQHAQELSGAIGETLPAHGRCEVIAFGAGHQDSFSDLGVERARTVVDAWTHRTRALYAMDGIEQVFCFENRGADIGVTLHHPHGQIYAYPYVPARVATYLRRARAHRAATGGSLFEDVLDFELAAGSRIVHRGEHWTLFVPFSARMPLEVHLTPNRHVGDLTELTENERAELARVYLDLVRGVDAIYATPTPYIAAWFQAPARRAGETYDDGREDFRLHLQLTSPRRAENKLKYLAGSEAAMGAFIGDVMPEAAAGMLREAMGYEIAAGGGEGYGEV